MPSSRCVASPPLALARALSIAVAVIALCACTRLDRPESPPAGGPAPRAAAPPPRGPRSTTFRGEAPLDGDPPAFYIWGAGSHGCASFKSNYMASEYTVACWTAPLLSPPAAPPQKTPGCIEPCATPIGHTQSIREVAVSPHRVCHVDPSNPSAITCFPLPTPPSTAPLWNLAIPPVPAAGSSPHVRPPELRSFELGTSHGCLLRDDGLTCWGDNQFGQLGIGSTESRSTPHRVQLPRATVLATGAFHSCAVLADGGVACWGRNDQGQLGFASTDRCPVDSIDHPCSVLPRRVPGLTGVGRVALGATFSCALRGDEVTCWGAGAPRAVARGASSISAGPRGLCARLPEHRAGCWGDIPNPELDHILSIVASDDLTASACAVRLDLTLWCWGEGYSPPDARARPVRVHFRPRRDGSRDAVAASEEEPADCAAPREPAAPPLEPHVTCLARRSCERPTTELPRCTRVEDALSWDEVRLRADALIGRSIAVRGPLHVSPIMGCTLLACQFIHCCNDVTSPYVISSGDSEPLELPNACVGDESRLCCPWRAEGQTVIAVGVLRGRDARTMYKWSTYGLEGAEVCEVRD
jgi:hypothetical protein